MQTFFKGQLRAKKNIKKKLPPPKKKKNHEILYFSNFGKS
jgi:hypothetical protein